MVVLVIILELLVALRQLEHFVLPMEAVAAARVMLLEVQVGLRARPRAMLLQQVVPAEAAQVARPTGRYPALAVRVSSVVAALAFRPLPTPTARLAPTMVVGVVVPLRQVQFPLMVVQARPVL
jgi:hypothetical protein